MNAIGFQSDSHLLIDTCLSRLRIDAGLDDRPILPSIDVLPEVEVLADSDLLEDEDDFIQVDDAELVIECDGVKELPSAASIVRQAVKANAQSQKEVPTVPVRCIKPAQQAVKHARWPLILCALVATYCGVTAFIKSPLGAKPEVQHVVKVSRTQISGVLNATSSLVRP